MTEARCSTIVRAPAAAVFDAFVEPDILTRYWLDAASAPLAPGATVEWTFKVPGATASVAVTAFERDRRLAWRWPDGVSVEIRFEALAPAATIVRIVASGFEKQGADAAIDTTEGFATVLCDLKTLLEQGRSAGLVADKAALIARGHSAP